MSESERWTELLDECERTIDKKDARIRELEAALEAALPSLRDLKTQVEKRTHISLPDDSRLVVAIETAEALLKNKVQS